MFRDWNSEHCRWIEQHDWSYTREFTLTPEDISEEAGIPELLFEGLDTYCEIRLNDVLVGTAENMFIPHRFCVKGRLRAGVNTLSFAGTRRSGQAASQRRIYDRAAIYAPDAMQLRLGLGRSVCDLRHLPSGTSALA